MESNEKKIFIARAITWALLAGACPVAFIGWRYDLFRKAGELQLSGWGFIGIIILFLFLRAFVGYVKAGFKKWSMTKQIVSGVAKVILPLMALLALCMGIRANLDYFIQALSMTIICEMAAIPVNPFPKWVYESSLGETESVMEMFAMKMDNVNKKKKED